MRMTTTKICLDFGRVNGITSGWPDYGPNAQHFTKNASDACLFCLYRLQTEVLADLRIGLFEQLLEGGVKRNAQICLPLWLVSLGDLVEHGQERLDAVREWGPFTAITTRKKESFSG
jgi:hypothetical protein